MTHQIFGPFSKMIKDDINCIIIVVVSHYDNALYYIISHMRPYNVRRVVSKKLLKNLNVKYKTETFTKNDLILIEGSYLNTKMLEKLFFILIFSKIDILICSINYTNDSIILLGKIVKSTSDSYHSLVCKITAFSAMKIIYILMIEIVLNLCITLLEKCNYRLGYFIFQITATHTFCKTSKIDEFLQDFLYLSQNSNIFYQNKILQTEIQT